MWLTTLVYRNIARRRIRSALTVAGMAIAVAAVVALVGIANGFERSFSELYAGQGVDVVVVRARVADRMTSVLDESLDAEIAQLSEVESVQPVLLDVISIEEAGLYGIVIQGVAPASTPESERTTTEGRWFQDNNERAVVLGAILARNLGKSVGDQLEIYEDEFFEIVGIYDRQNIFENGAMLMPLGQLQMLLGQEGLVTAFNVRATRPTSGEQIEQLVARIDALGPGVSALATDEYVATDAKIQVATAMAWSTSAIALVIGAIGMLNTMIVSVFERTGEIGILRAIGWRKSRIVRMILLESSLLSLAGAVIGVLLALLLTNLLSRAPVTSSMVEAWIAPHVMLQGLMIALLIGLLGALYPAFRAARLMPTVALRNEG